MSRTMIQAAVTMNQLQRKLDIIGHNLANSQTTGYKSRNSEFSSLLYQQLNHLTNEADLGERQTPEGIRVGSGAALGAIQMDLATGTQIQTDRALDVALMEDHLFFQIEVEDGEDLMTQYTRDGSFYLSPLENNPNLLMLTTKDGYPVLGVDGPIVFNDGFEHIQIEQNGEVTLTRGNVTEVVGQLALVEMYRPELLEAVGQNNFQLPDLNQLNITLQDVMQPAQMTGKVLSSGTLESSNVDLTKELTDLLMTQRAYQFNAQTISMNDQMLGLINQLRR